MTRDPKPRHNLAVPILTLALAAWTFSPSPAIASAKPAAHARKTATGTVQRGDSLRGSAENPIPLNGAEIVGPRRHAFSLRDRLEFHAGPLRGSIAGSSGVLAAPGGHIYRPGSLAAYDDASVYWGEAIDLRLGPSKNVVLDGGRVTLGNPIDVPEWRGSDIQYWTTSAGLQVRF